MKIRKFNESFTEKVKFEDFIKDIRAKNEQEFDECCASKGVKWTVSLYLGDAAGVLGWSFPSGNNYEMVSAWNEKGDGKDESTDYGIFKRLSDGKHFKLWVHDGGFIGPQTITVCEYLEEIDPLDAHKDELKNFYE